LNILTNAVIVWNTVYMQAALEALREEGYAVKDEDLVHLSPARFAHIHRYSTYHFDLERGLSSNGADMRCSTYLFICRVYEYAECIESRS
jgi:hypothetical protein